MKKICVDLTACRALGDTLCATPTLRKISNSYNNKISVISHHQEIFYNLPYIENTFQYSHNILEGSLNTLLYL